MSTTELLTSRTHLSGLSFLLPVALTLRGLLSCGTHNRLMPAGLQGSEDLKGRSTYGWRLQRLSCRPRCNRSES